MLRADTGRTMLRFVDGRPVSQVTEDFLGWVCRELAAEDKKVFALAWDNASWHVSGRVTAQIEAHNARVGREGGCAIRARGLPVKAPWLNRIEPKWMHAKRAVAEPVRKLAGAELKQRVCEYLAATRPPTRSLILHESSVSATFYRSPRVTGSRPAGTRGRPSTAS